MTTYRPKQIQYPRLPFASKPKEEKVLTFSVAGTIQDGNPFTLEMDAPGAFLDPSRSYFTYTITPTLTGGANVNLLGAFLDGGSHCVIKDYQTQVSNGTVDVDDIKEYHKFYNFMTDVAPKDFLEGQFTATSGGPVGKRRFRSGADLAKLEDHKYLGCTAMVSGTAYTFSHQPLGFLSPAQSKWVPLFLTGPIRWTIATESGARALVCQQLTRAATYITGEATVVGNVYTLTNCTYTLTNIQYHAHLIYLDNAEIDAYLKAASAAPLEIPFETVKHNSEEFTTSGGKNIGCIINAQSLKSLFLLPRDKRLATTAAANNVESKFGSPYLTTRTHGEMTGIQLRIGDKFYPQNPMTCTVLNYCTTYNELMKAAGRLGDISMPTGLNREKWMPTTTDILEDVDAGAYVAGATNTAPALVESQFAIGFDLESFPSEGATDPNISGLNTKTAKVMQVEATLTLAANLVYEVDVYGVCDAKLMLSPSINSLWI